MGLMLDCSGVADTMMRNFVKVFGVRAAAWARPHRHRYPVGSVHGHHRGRIGRAAGLCCPCPSCCSTTIRRNIPAGWWQPGHAGYSHTAVHHAGAHGRPSLRVGGRPVHGRAAPGLLLGVLHGVCRSCRFVRPDIVPPCPAGDEKLTVRQIGIALSVHAAHLRPDSRWCWV